MGLFSDCSGPCEKCQHFYTDTNCLAGHGDDYFVQLIGEPPVRLNSRPLSEKPINLHDEFISALCEYDKCVRLERRKNVKSKENI